MLNKSTCKLQELMQDLVDARHLDLGEVGVVVCCLPGKPKLVLSKLSCCSNLFHVSYFREQQRSDCSVNGQMLLAGKEVACTVPWRSEAGLPGKGKVCG
jgi:hypothetical protein